MPPASAKSRQHAISLQEVGRTGCVQNSLKVVGLLTEHRVDHRRHQGQQGGVPPPREEYEQQPARKRKVGARPELLGIHPCQERRQCRGPAQARVPRLSARWRASGATEVKSTCGAGGAAEAGGDASDHARILIPAGGCTASRRQHHGQCGAVGRRR